MFWSWDVSQAGSKFSGLVEFHIRILHSLPGGSDVKASACNVGDLGSIPGLGRSPGKGKATHSGILTWRIPWTEEPGGLPSMGSQRVAHD